MHCVSLLHRKEDTLTRVYRSYLTWEITVRYDRGICESVTRKHPDYAKPLFNFANNISRHVYLKLLVPLESRLLGGSLAGQQDQGGTKFYEGYRKI